MSNGEQGTQQLLRARLICHGENPVFVDKVAELLSSSFSVEQEDGGESLSPFDVETLLGLPGSDWIEVILIFASTTLATSILNKLGEDLYQRMKSETGKFATKKKKKGPTHKKPDTSSLKKLKEKLSGEQIKLTIIIKDTKIFEGAAYIPDETTLAEVFEATMNVILDKEVVDDASSDDMADPEWNYNPLTKEWMKQSLIDWLQLASRSPRSASRKTPLSKKVEKQLRTPNQ